MPNVDLFTIKSSQKTLLAAFYCRGGSDLVVLPRFFECQQCAKKIIYYNSTL